MRNMKKTLFGFLTFALLSTMLSMPVSAAEVRGEHDAMELQLDEAMMEEVNELSDFLTQYLAIEDDKLILTGGSEHSSYDEAQEVVRGLNESGARFGYGPDGTVIVNPEEATMFGTVGTSGISLREGSPYALFDEHSSVSELSTYGLKSTIISKIIKGYNALPTRLKKILGYWAGLSHILAVLDHWTGVVEDGIYSACMGLFGWSPGANYTCWVITKGLTMYLF